MHLLEQWWPRARPLDDAWIDARFTWFAGQRSDLDGDVVLASIQKLSRPEHLVRLAAGRFDYVPPQRPGNRIGAKGHRECVWC